ncbi:hypothetical protein PYCCODRAFT_1432350 [Trametes coccinea BRFM310]|uniref:Uncharacterized protein n=1 Tax=Trametes coccinea (strain BRFM310) TaxID=1353009 RepID=A0A1Y2IYZ2_TRAC3|nr:hypothetical protein PYCCODRAFT_1432350 [Trametes coccinea BRFM310]
MALAHDQLTYMHMYGMDATRESWTSARQPTSLILTATALCTTSPGERSSSTT